LNRQLTLRGSGRAKAAGAEFEFIENFGSETPSFHDGFTVKY